jgi:hypothetical protein
MLPKTEWPGRSAKMWKFQRRTVAEIYSQGKTSACVGFGIAQAIETRATRQYGLRHRVPLSGMSVYDQIGSTLMSGAYIPDGIRYAQDTGPLPLRTAETVARYSVTFPGLDYRWRRPAGWITVARRFRVVKAAKLQGLEMLVSALIRNHTIVVGYSRHAVPLLGYDHPNAGYANSWSSKWGDGGWGYTSPSILRDLVGYVILEVAVRPELELIRAA